MIAGHGDDLYAYRGKIKHNFSSNILSGVDHSRMLEVMIRQGSMISNYPQPVPSDLEDKLAWRIGLPGYNVRVTNGATESIYLIAHGYSGACSAIVVPTFSEYEDACEMYHHEIVFWREMDEVPSGVNLVWLCNPNNPTGKVMDYESLRRIIFDNPDVTFVIDQAYADYTDRKVITPMEAVDMGNVVILGSFTKRFSVPGLRLGYMVGNYDLLERACDYRMPWSVSGPAIVCADYLLDHAAEYSINVKKLHEEALRIAKEFKRLGISVEDTDCNFLLCRLAHGTSAELKEYLAENHGILIRDASNFRTLNDRYFRVAAQTPHENDLLISAVRQWITL